MKTCLSRLVPLAIISALSLAQTSYAQVVDTDGDGIPDSFETNTGTFINPENTGTDPNKIDTDSDGLNDNIETGSGLFVSAVNTGTDPNKKDTDGDALEDGDELNPSSSGFYKSNPVLADTDGDTFNDKAERDASPSSNPWDPTSIPGGAPVASCHAIPVQQGATQPIAIDESFAPFGHRPERDKNGDDGSAAIIDSNGVLIWTNSAGEALTVPGATFAKTLHVSNTECVVYNSRYKNYNSENEVAEVVIHRREPLGAKYISGTPVNVPGTLLDAPGITPNTYGFMVVSGQRSDDGEESTRVTDAGAFGEDTEKVDQWDTLTLTLNQITWDGVPLARKSTDIRIPKSEKKNLTDGRVYSHGVDGSMLVAMNTAATTLDRYDDVDPGVFAKELTTIWISTSPDGGGISVIPGSIKEDLGAGAFKGGNGTATITLPDHNFAVGDELVISGAKFSLTTTSNNTTTTDTINASNPNARITARTSGNFTYTISGNATGYTSETKSAYARKVIPLQGAAYVDSNRAIVEMKNGSSRYLWDLSKNPGGTIPVNNSLELTTDERLWAISQDAAKISGIDPLVYTLDDTTAATPTLRAYRCGDTIAQFGTDVVLPNKVLSSDPVVVNPRDGSLLVKAGSSGLLWIPATTTGFGTPVLIPNTQQAKPLFVSKDQAVAWINGEALPLNGALPPVELKHYQLSGGAISTTTPLTPPIEGNYVMLPHPLTPDPDLEGWFIRTFEKNSPTTTLFRNYKLNLATKADIDDDGVSDLDELAGTFGAQTDPFDPDTDDDGLSDGREVLPFTLVSGSFGWEEARIAAVQAGQRLAVLGGKDAQDRIAAWLFGNKPTGAMWVGGHDTIQEGTFRWLDEAGGKSGAFVANRRSVTSASQTGNNTVTMGVQNHGLAVGSSIVVAGLTGGTPPNGTFNVASIVGNNSFTYVGPTSQNFTFVVTSAIISDLGNWAPGQPSHPNDADGMQITSSANFKWSIAPISTKQGYISEAKRSNPIKADTDGDGVTDKEERDLKSDPTKRDTDGDGLNDRVEKTAGTSPILVDTDGDNLTDYAERITHKTDPLKKDTDGDALEDDDEISVGTNPKVTDTDKDGLLDGDEVKRGTNPKSKDTDTDGLTDDKEVLVHKTNPLKTDSDGDLISDFDEVAKGSNPNNKNDPKNIDTDKDGLKNFDELFVHNTNPNKADTDGDGINDNVEITNGGDPLDAESDTDGDGLKDKVETRTKFFLSATNTGTNPYDSDSDNDGLSDKVETGTGKFVSMSNTGANPNTPDTDGDGLDDKEETTGIRKTNHIAPVFTSSPFLIDTDGDLVGDFDESNARPKTNPRDPSKYPTIGGIKPISSLHALPVPLGDAQQVKINEPFAPYGHRPDRDKVGDDGSGTVIDRNGVLIWTNKSGEALSIPNSSSAKTLHVSNTECLVYNNRFIDGWNSAAHQAQIIIHRRGLTGGIIASKPLTINGTVLDTASVTPTTYGFMLVSGKRVDDGNESTQVTQVTRPGNPTVVAEVVSKVDKWDGLDLTLNIITWDGVRRTLAGGRYSIPKSSGTNFTDQEVMGYGSDGSLLLNITTAATFLDRYDDPDPGEFDSKTSSIWVSATINQESVRELPIPAIDTLAYVDNSRLIGQRGKFGSVNQNEIVDYRQFSKGAATLISDRTLSAGENMLPLAEHSMRGLSPYIYTINDAGKSLKLYRADATITSLGTAVTLPFAVSDSSGFVRNPRDGSLLIKSVDGPLIWVPTTTNGTSPAVTGLAIPRVIPNSIQGEPLFVTSKECVVWLNSGAPPLNGILPPASISHFQIIANRLVPATIAPPMEGNYVVLPPALSPDPDLEGWYLSTFEKDAPSSTLMRTYQLQLAGDADRDGDGISDYDELTGRFSNANPKVATDPMNSDSDGDGLSDGRELLPFVFVSTPLPWESARIAAITKGGKLAVLNSSGKQLRFQTMMKAAKASGKFWIGGHDKLKEGEFRWITNDGQATSSGSLVQSASSYENWQDQQPSNLPNNSDAMEVSSAAAFKWAMAPESRMHGYVIEYPFSDPNKADGSGDADGDGLADSDEVNVHKTNPNKADTDTDGLSDLTEAAVLFSNPLTGFLSGAPVTLAKASYEGLLYSEKNGLLGKISVNMENNGAFTGTYEIYNGFKSSIKGTLNKNNGLLVANSFAAKPAIGATTIALQRDSQTRRNHLHVRVNNPIFGLLFAKARPATDGFKPARNRFTLEAPLSEEASGPTGTMVATGSIAASGGITSLQMYNPDGTTASSSGKVLDGGVIALYAKSSGSAPTHVIANIKVNNVLNTKSNFDAQLRLFTNEYDQARTLEGSFYTAPAPRTLPISSFNASNTANNAVFNWTSGELDKAYQVYSWRPDEISPPKISNDKTVATYTSASGLVKVDYTRSDKARNLYQAKSAAYAVVNQRKNTVNGYYSRINWEGGSFSVDPNLQKLTNPLISPPDAPIFVQGTVSSISPTTKIVGSGGASHDIVVTGVDNWKVAIPQTAEWVSAEVLNNDGSVWADKLTGRDSAQVKFKVLANTTGTVREIMIKIGDLDHKITQSAGSIASITPATMSAVAAGDSYSIRVLGSGIWKLAVPATWIKAYVVNDNGYIPATGFVDPLKNIEGQGNATVNVTVAPNQTTSTRSASLIMGDKKHTITQRPVFLAGTVASISSSSWNVAAAASTYNFRVSGKDNWRTVVTGGSWLEAEVVNDDGYDETGKLTGSGNATIKVTVAANSSLNRRVGTIKVGSKVHTVTQAPIIESGRVSSTSPTVKELGKEQATYNIRVTGTKNWTISILSGSSWLSAKVVNDNGFVYTAAPNVTGSGNATVQVTVAANATNQRRQGSINIGGQTHTCIQSYRSIR